MNGIEWTPVEYDGPESLRDGDTVELKGVAGRFEWTGRTNGNGVLIRLGSGPKPVWVPSADIARIRRPAAPEPSVPGLYRSAGGGVWLLDGDGLWSMLRDDGGDGWTAPTPVTWPRVSRRAPLWRLGLGED